MRRLPKRSNLTPAMLQLLQDQTTALAVHADPKAEAERLYGNARKAAWFRPVVVALQKLSGKAQRCMFCSGSESSDVEHFRPKADYPHDCFKWENYLWCCTICNRHKGDKFPFDAAGNPVLLNPLDVDPWDVMFIDKFGLLTARFDVALNALNPRGEATIRDVGLDREALQESRRARLRDIKEQVLDAIQKFDAGEVTAKQLKNKVGKWRRQPFQADVADYFLRGPGKDKQPFLDLFDRINR
jgi:uncharacterized protein (TIGR02646 family)